MLKSELADELSAFDYVYLIDVYSASESMIEGGTGKDLFECLSDRTKHCQYVGDCKLLNTLSVEFRDGEKINIVFLGAGETNILASEFAENLKAGDPRWGGFFEALGPVASPSTVLRRNEPLRTKTTLRVGERLRCILSQALRKSSWLRSNTAPKIGYGYSLWGGGRI